MDLKICKPGGRGPGELEGMLIHFAIQCYSFQPFEAACIGMYTLFQLSWKGLFVFFGSILPLTAGILYYDSFMQSDICVRVCPFLITVVCHLHYTSPWAITSMRSTEINYNPFSTSASFPSHSLSTLIFHNSKRL